MAGRIGAIRGSIASVKSAVCNRSVGMDELVFGGTENTLFQNIGFR
jgi:hypothetical protein